MSISVVITGTGINDEEIIETVELNALPMVSKNAFKTIKCMVWYERKHIGCLSYVVKHKDPPNFIVRWYRHTIWHIKRAWYGFLVWLLDDSEEDGDEDGNQL